jgi:two-component system LytT family response regulator
MGETDLQANVRVAIVDDEEPARALLREYLSAQPGVAVVVECANGFEAVRAANELDIDLFLLDVQMPGLSGFDVVELLEREVAVVFVTAHDEHALRAFDANAVDYLLKPFSAERLAEAVTRARQRLGRPRAGLAAVVAAARTTARPLARLLVREGPRVHVIPVEALDVAEARDDYVCLRVRGTEYRKQVTLGALEAQLDPATFVRAHRSFIVNLNRVSRIELYAKDSRLLVLEDGSKVPLSRAGYRRLRGRLPAAPASQG